MSTGQRSLAVRDEFGAFGVGFGFSWHAISFQIVLVGMFPNAIPTIYLKYSKFIVSRCFVEDNVILYLLSYNV